MNFNQKQTVGVRNYILVSNPLKLSNAYYPTVNTCSECFLCVFKLSDTLKLFTFYFKVSPYIIIVLSLTGRKKSADS
jgi:hypothetical protein